MVIYEQRLEITRFIVDGDDDEMRRRRMRMKIKTKRGRGVKVAGGVGARPARAAGWAVTHNWEVARAAGQIVAQLRAWKAQCN